MRHYQINKRFIQMKMESAINWCLEEIGGLFCSTECGYCFVLHMKNNYRIKNKI